MDLSTFLQNNLALLERYILAADPLDFLRKEVVLPQERKLFDFLLSPLSDKEKELVAGLPLNESERQLLLNSKAFRHLETAATEEEKNTLIAKLKTLQYGLNFDYPKPAEAASQAQSQSGQETQKREAVRFETESTVQAVVLRALAQDPNNFSKLSNYGIKNLPLSHLAAIKDESQLQFLYSKPEIIRSLDAGAVAQLFSKMVDRAVQEKHTSQPEEFPAEFFSVLSIEQLDELKRIRPKLFESYEYHLQLFRIKYEQEFSKFKPIATLSFEQRNQKKEFCLKALKELSQSGKDFYENLIEKLREEVLLIGQALVNSDQDLFLAYLTGLKSFQYQHLDTKFKTEKRELYGRNKYANRGFPTLDFLESSRVSQSQIINKTVVSLFKNGNEGTLQALAPFLSRTFLVKEQAKVRLSRGAQKDIPNIHQIFTLDELTALKERRELTFLSQNKKRFGRDEAIKLEIRVKNVRKIAKKVYFIDMEKQLLQSGANIDEQINLKFLVPEKIEEIIVKETADAFEEIKADIDFPQLQRIQGEFIIQLQGEGISSRALIRRGKIILQNKPTPIGHELTFFDGEGQSIPNLVLWRDGKKIEVNEKYFIPYGPQNSQQIIAVSNGYAEQIFVNISSEQFRFTCDYLYHSESFIVGNKARIVLHPTLKLNQQTTSLSRLQKVSITISAVNNQGISSTQVIENVSFRDNEDYVVEYPVKSYLKGLRVNIDGEIQLINKQITKVTHSTNIGIDLEEGNENFIDLYLERGYQGEYRLKIRGKNGESIPNAGVTLSYEQFGVNFSFSKDLTTDEQGEFSLGLLSQVVKLTVQASHNSFTSVRTWRLNNYGDSISYGGNMYAYNTYKVTLKQGDDLILPLPCQLDLDRDIIFQQQNQLLEVHYNRLSDVKLTKEKLSLSKLGVGKYTLILLRFNRKIDVEVIAGRPWIGGKIINDQHVAFGLNNKPQNLLSLADIKAETKDDHIEYSIDILSAGEALPSDLRVHIFAKNYIDSQLPNALNCEGRVCCPKPDAETVSFRDNSYFSNKRLSDETAYVLNRKNQEVTNGNNLEKPHIFLKRTEVRATSEKEEELRGEGAFDLANERSYNMAAKCMPRSMMYADYGYSNESAAFGGRGFYSVTLPRAFNSHNNFLHKVGHLSANLKKIEGIRVPKGYNQISVILFSGENTIKREYSLPEGKAELLKLTHAALADESNKSGWTMSREIYQIRAGQKKEISRSSTWTTVALSNVVEYAKIQGVSLPEWLTSWRNYSPEKKLEVYDKEVSHELNFFLYRNDPTFFVQVVKSFISNKLKKTFIDHYLLDDKEEILNSSKTHLLIRLNYFERALLVQKLKQHGLDKEAEHLASALELPLKALKRSNEDFKQFFETILNAKKDQPSPTSQPFAMGGAFGAPGALYSALPPPISYSAMPQMAMQEYQMQFTDECCYHGDIQMVAQAKEAYKPGFRETEKTKEYTETTYSGVTNPDQSASLIPLSPFWAELARHFASGTLGAFLSDKFSHLSQKVEFVLACAVLSNDSQAEFELATNQEGGYAITAKNSFLVFVREVKSLPFEESKNIVLNQRFFDPKNRFRFDEDGAQTEREVDCFLVQKPFTLQTLLTNISGSNLEVQLLMDIPEGAIPLLSHEQTQIINVSLPAYNTRSFERVFYFPEDGTFTFYPANASKGKAIIAKSAQIPPLAVSRKEAVGKLQTLDNILRAGSNADILSFISGKNIFDANVFSFSLILWKLKDREFFNQVISILKERQLYDHTVWSFSFYHNDFELIQEYLANGPRIGEAVLTLPIFEYYPYYSRRAHKFADENKSTIRVQEFRENYARFLFNGIFTGSTSHPHYTLTLIYYLLLQDRIAEARALNRTVGQAHRAKFSLQYDYIDCFLDMYDGRGSDYAVARKISEKYREYPVLAWRKLFNDVYNTLNRGEEELSEESTKAEEVAFATSVVNAGTEVRISRPAQVTVHVSIYQIDIELYFSEFPFAQIAQFSAIKPIKTVTYDEPGFKVEKLERKTHSHLKNVFVEIYEQKGGNALSKVTSFFWNNPEVRVKVNEREGTLKVFHNGKKCPTSYVKVYSRGSKGEKFARDGYTDVASTFRYALDVKDVQEFAILVLTDFGGSIHKVKPPSLY